MVTFLRYWLPLSIWMAIIFTASADAQSTQRTSRFLEPFLRWVWPEVTPGGIELVRWLVRKSAHVLEYAILAGLWWRALRRPMRGDARPWAWGAAGGALLATVLYAATDEWHQSFVANRTGAVSDVLIDTVGGVIGLGVVWCFYRPRRVSIRPL